MWIWRMWQEWSTLNCICTISGLYWGDPHQRGSPPPDETLVIKNLHQMPPAVDFPQVPLVITFRELTGLIL